MKNIKPTLFVLAILLAAAHNGAAVEIIVIDLQGGFEEPQREDAGHYEKWWFNGSLKLPFSHDQHKGGVQSVVLPLSQDSAGKAQMIERFIDPSLVKPGDRIILFGEVYLKNSLDPEDRVSLGLCISDPKWHAKASAQCKITNRSGVWQEVGAAATVPEEYNANWHIKLIMSTWRRNSPSTGNQVFFDDIAASIERRALPK